MIPPTIISTIISKNLEFQNNPFNFAPLAIHLFLNISCFFLWLSAVGFCFLLFVFLAVGCCSLRTCWHHLHRARPCPPLAVNLDGGQCHDKIRDYLRATGDREAGRAAEHAGRQATEQPANSSLRHSEHWAEITLRYFTWNPSPLRSSKLSFSYLLLPPRCGPAGRSVGGRAGGQPRKQPAGTLAARSNSRPTSRPASRATSAHRGASEHSRPGDSSTLVGKGQLGSALMGPLKF